MLSQLAAQGVDPRTVIDVGAAGGTLPLYRTWPRARHLLIEPLEEYAPALREICRDYDALHVAAAAGRTPGRATLHVHADLEGSSLYREAEEPEVDGIPRETPLVTLDQLAAEHELPGPYLIKADVQGAELDVLAGAETLLPRTEALILETTLFGTFAGAPRLLDVCNWMADQGFAVHDLFGALYRPLDGALIQIDAVFVPADGPLRRRQAYATPEQRG